MDRHVRWLRRRIFASVASQTAQTFVLVAAAAFALLQWRTGEGPLTSMFVALVIAQLVALGRVGHALRNNPLNYMFMNKYVERPFGYRVTRFRDDDEAHEVAAQLPGFTAVATIRDPEADPEPIFDIFHDPSRLVAASVSRASGAVALVSSLADDRVMVTDAHALPPHERLVMNVAPENTLASIIATHQRAVASRRDIAPLVASAHQVVLDSLTLEYESYLALGPLLSPFLDLAQRNRSYARLVARIPHEELSKLPERLGPDMARRSEVERVVPVTAPLLPAHPVQPSLSETPPHAVETNSGPTNSAAAAPPAADVPQVVVASAAVPAPVVAAPQISLPVTAPEVVEPYVAQPADVPAPVVPAATAETRAPAPVVPSSVELHASEPSIPVAAAAPVPQEPVPPRVPEAVPLPSAVDESFDAGFETSTQPAVRPLSAEEAAALAAVHAAAVHSAAAAPVAAVSETPEVSVEPAAVFDPDSVGPVPEAESRAPVTEEVPVVAIEPPAICVQPPTSLVEQARAVSSPSLRPSEPAVASEPAPETPPATVHPTPSPEQPDSAPVVPWVATPSNPPPRPQTLAEAVLAAPDTPAELVDPNYRKPLTEQAPELANVFAPVEEHSPDRPRLSAMLRTPEQPPLRAPRPKRSRRRSR